MKTIKKQKKSISLAKHVHKYWPYYIMVIPGVVFLIIFKFIPMFGSVIAFQNYSTFKGILKSNWVGLANFKKLFAYPDFQRVFTNTLVLGLLKLIICFPAPIILSLMLNELNSKHLKKTIQTAIYIPHFLSWIIIAQLIFDFLGVDGIFNIVRGWFGAEPILVMQQSRYFRPVFVISSIWKEAGWGTVVYLASISGIDSTFYEAAEIDGASRIKMIRYITFPLLLPTIVTLLLLQMGSFLELGFEQVYSLLTPMTFSTGDIFDTYVYRAGILQAQYSYTTAIGLFQSVIGFIMVVLFNKLANKYSDTGGLW